MAFNWPHHDQYMLFNQDDLIFDVKGVMWIRARTVMKWIKGVEGDLRLPAKTSLDDKSMKAPMGDVLSIHDWSTSPQQNTYVAPFLSISGILMLLNDIRGSSSLTEWLLKTVLPGAEVFYRKQLIKQLSNGVLDAVPKVCFSL